MIKLYCPTCAHFLADLVGQAVRVACSHCGRDILFTLCIPQEDYPSRRLVTVLIPPDPQILQLPECPQKATCILAGERVK